MRRIVVVAVLAGVGFLIARGRLAKLHQGLMARCKEMFDRMPDDFPPKRMMSGVEEIRANTARVLELLEARGEEAGDVVVRDPSPSEARTL